MKTLYLITGPAGVGKSTISKMIAESSEKSCLIEGDDIYHLVVGGYESPWKEGNHLDLFWQQCLGLIETSLNFGYDVVFNYIIMKDRFEQVVKRFAGKDVVIKFVVLLAEEEALLKRDAQRPEDCQMGERVLVLLNEFKQEHFDVKHILDTSKMDEKQTAAKICSGSKYVVKI